MAKSFINEWKNGVLNASHSDESVNFKSYLFKKPANYHKTRTTPYHPQSEWLVERLNQNFKILLRINMKQVPEDMWDEELPLLLLAYHRNR